MPKSELMSRGYFGIGVYHPKTSVNIGTLWRSGLNFSADFLFTIGPRYKAQASDTLKTTRHVPLWHFTSFEEFLEHSPYNCKVIAVEQAEGAVSLGNFIHPERAIYLLGAEDAGLPSSILQRCYACIQIDTQFCLNVAVAGSIVMYDRTTRRAD